MTPEELNQKIAQLPEKLVWGQPSNLAESTESVESIIRQIDQLSLEISAWCNNKNL
jgi:hypothetical protein